MAAMLAGIEDKLHVPRSGLIIGSVPVWSIKLPNLSGLPLYQQATTRSRFN
jgi:hypothetical protein